MRILVAGSREFPIRGVHNDVGGIDFYIDNLSKHLLRLGHSLYVFSRFVQGKGVTESISERVTVIHTPFIRVRLLRLIISDFFAFFFSLFMIRRWKIDLIHIHETIAGFFFAKIARIFRIPLVGQIHTFGSKQPEWPNIVRILLKKTEISTIQSSNTVILLCTEAQNDVVTNYGCSPEKIEIIPNAVDFERFSSIQTNKKCYNKDKPLLISFIGRLTESKGIPYLINAIKHLKLSNDALPPFNVKIAGDGPLKDKLIQFVHKLGLSDQIRFLGYIKDIKPLLDSTDIFVLPSLYEGIPLALLEAMASGCAVIGSEVGGIPDIIKNTHTGFLVKPGDSKALANRISLLLKDDELRTKLGKSGCEQVRNNFRWVNIVQAISQIYNQISLSKLNRLERY